MRCRCAVERAQPTLRRPNPSRKVKLDSRITISPAWPSSREHEHQGASLDPDGLRLQVTRGHDRPGDAQPRRLLPPAARPPRRSVSTHGTSRRAIYTCQGVKSRDRSATVHQESWSRWLSTWRQRGSPEQGPRAARRRRACRRRRDRITDHAQARHGVGVVPMALYKHVANKDELRARRDIASSAWRPPRREGKARSVIVRACIAMPSGGT